MLKSSRSRFFLFVLVLTVIVLAVAATASAKPKGGDQVSVADIEYLDIVTFPTGTMFDGTEVGGLSGLAYDGNRGVYYVLSDDRSERYPARYYTVDIEYDGQLSVDFLDTTFLLDENRELFGNRAVDPEGMDLPVPGYNYISTEGDDTSPPIDPFVDRYNPVGKQTRALPLPGKFLYTVPGNFIRDNLGFEALTSTPNRRYLVTATENALENDGPLSTLTDYSPSRVLAFDLNRKVAGHEFVYCVNPIPKAAVPPATFADNGLTSLQALDNVGTFLAMERSFAVDVGNTIILYETSTQGATDVSGIEALNLAGCPDGGIVPMSKETLVDLDEFGPELDPDNMEGMVFGPTLPDGRQLLILVSDNNFRGSQTTQFVALAVELE